MSAAFAPSKESMAADACLILRDVLLFCRHGSGVTLRAYQQEVALAVIDSVMDRRGLSEVVMFPRQSGKNELQAQLEAYLLLHVFRPGWGDRQGLAHLEAAIAERHAPPGAHAQAQPADLHAVGEGSRLHLPGGLGAHLLPLRRAREQHRGRHRLHAAGGG